MKAPDPQTPEQWQDAVDAAHVGLVLDACRQYGLVTGGPTFNLDRCHEILQAGERRGVRPSPQCRGAVRRPVAGDARSTLAVSCERVLVTPSTQGVKA